MSKEIVRLLMWAVGVWLALGVFVIFVRCGKISADTHVYHPFAIFLKHFMSVNKIYWAAGIFLLTDVFAYVIRNWLSTIYEHARAFRCFMRWLRLRISTIFYIFSALLIAYPIVASCVEFIVPAGPSFPYFAIGLAGFVEGLAVWFGARWLSEKLEN
jgi:hypothetical protein